MNDEIMRAVARELDVHVLAWNAGAGLPTPGVRYVTIDNCTFDGPVAFDDVLIGRWTGGAGEWDGPGLVLPAGWAAWYAAGDELR